MMSLGLLPVVLCAQSAMVQVTPMANGRNIIREMRGGEMASGKGKGLRSLRQEIGLLRRPVHVESGYVMMSSFNIERSTAKELLKLIDKQDLTYSAFMRVIIRKGLEEYKK